MRMVDLIIKKRDGHELSDEEIRFWIEGYTRGDIPDYQSSAMNMAILFRGMTKREIATLTDYMEQMEHRMQFRCFLLNTLYMQKKVLYKAFYLLYSNGV